MKLSPATQGMLLGLVGVVIFAITLPMTRLATGTQAAPQLSAWFLTFGRAVLAAVLSILFLLLTRSPLPARAHYKPLALAMLGNAIGFPLLLGLALRQVTSGHAAVFTALLPLTTATLAAWVFRQRAHWGFWLCAGLGGALVVAFSLLRAQALPAVGDAADLLLVGAVLCAAMGYVYGAQITPQLGAERVICWVCVLALPITLPGTLLYWPTQPVHWSAWLGFGYVGVFSMWAGFFAWYRGLAIGGALRVSQVQLLQPFFSILAAVPLLGEPLEAATVGFALAVVTTVFLGKRLSSPTSTPAQVSSPSHPQ